MMFFHEEKKGMNEKLLTASEFLVEAKDVFVITGAGISADSGLPTYRGVGGLYDGVDTEDGFPIEAALSGTMFRSRPEITWKYLAQIEQGARGAAPNRAHEILAEMESHFERFWILTQNIDAFHSQAGSENVIEIHGNMYRMKCTECVYARTYENYESFEVPPFCPDCNAMVRPDVVLFDEQLPLDAVNELYTQLEKPFDLVISIGTSSHFPYIVEPVRMAFQRGIPTIEINPSETAISSIVDVKLDMGAKAALERLWPLESTS